MTPSLPRWGGIQGEQPLDPQVLVNFLMLSLYGGCPSGRGRKHEVARAPKSDSSIPCMDFYRARVFFYNRLLMNPLHSFLPQDFHQYSVGDCIILWRGPPDDNEDKGYRHQSQGKKGHTQPGGAARGGGQQLPSLILYHT